MPKIFCLKLPDVLVKLGKISTGRNRNLTGNFRRPVHILTPLERMKIIAQIFEVVAEQKSNSEQSYLKS